jgi:Rad3-related DNA helicase
VNSAISNLIIHSHVRPQQERTFNTIQQNWGKFHSFFCSLPTGSGKTDLAACLLSDYLLSNPEGKIDVLVPYKMHQDFWYTVLTKYGRKHGFSVALLKGRGSYYCPIVKSGANISPCAFDPPYARTCKSRQRCQLLKARRDIRKAKVRILNWWVFKYVDLGDEKATFRIFDEAHNLLNLESLVRFEITSSQLKSITNNEKLISTYQEWEQNILKEQKYVELNLEEGINFLNQLKIVLSEKETIIAKQLNSSLNSMNLDILRDLRRVTELISAISELIKNPQEADLSIFLQREFKKKTTKLTVQPFDISYIFTRLFRGSKSLFMSATIGDGEYLAQMLGLNPKHCLYIREGSAFNKDNHPFILLKEAMKLSTANPEKKKQSFNFIKKYTQPFFADLYKNKQRGLVLASSFELARLIEGVARANGLVVVTHTEGKSDKAIKSFINSKEGDVLITPSGFSGISLDDDLARICLIPKVPFPMMFDPIIQRKTKKYPQFIENDVLITIQQGHGRIQRNKDDWGLTICFDDNFRWLKNKRRKVLEPWFVDRIQTLSQTEALLKFQNLLQNNTIRNNSPKQKQSRGSTRKITSKDHEWLQKSGLADLIQKKDDS